MRKVSLKELKKVKEQLLNNNKKNINNLNLDLQFLTYEQCFGNNTEKLKIIKKCGTKAAITDFAILLGGCVSDNNYNYEGKALENRTGWFWTKTYYGEINAHVVRTNGTTNVTNCLYHVYERDGGARPALPYSSISSIYSNKVRGRGGVLEVEFGEYPKSAVDNDMQRMLEILYSQSKLRKTNKVYTTDSRQYNEYDEGFLKQVHIVYEYNGKKFVRVRTNFYSDKTILSNDIKYKNGEYVWVEVEPIKWLVDEEADIAITKDIILAGVQFNLKRNYNEDFESTDIKKFMDEYLAKEIIQNIYSNTIGTNTTNVATATYEDAQNLINEAEQVLDNMNIDTIKKLNKAL